MKKIILLGLFVLMMTTVLTAQQDIDQITNISYDRLLQGYNDVGYINRYQNRLFINNTFKLQEYIIQDSGEPEPLASFEYRGVTSYLVSGITVPALIDEDRLYTVHWVGNRMHLSIYDLSTIPMVMIHTTEIPLLVTGATVISFLQVLGDTILIQDGFLGTIRFNKRDLCFETPLVGLLDYALYDTYYLKTEILIDETGYVDTYLRYYDSSLADTHNPWGVGVYDLFLGLDRPRETMNIKVENNLLYLLFRGYMVVYDITDRDNIVTVFSFTFEDVYFCDALLYDNYLFVADQWGIKFYDISIPTTPALVSQTINYISTHPHRNSLHIYNDKLYTYEYWRMGIYDIHDNLGFVNRFGLTTFDIFSSTKDYIVNNRLFDSSMIDIYPIFDDDSAAISIDTCFDYPSILAGFEITDDYLYAVTHSATTLSPDWGTSHFSIYDLNTSELLSREQIMFIVQSVRFLDDFVIFEQVRDGLLPLQHVFLFINLHIEPIDTFTGSLGAVTGFDPDDYFSVLTSNRIEFRDKSAPFNIIYSHPIFQPSMHSLEHVAKNVLGYRVNQIQYFYSYQDGFINFSQTFSMPVSSVLTTFYNGFMSLVDGSDFQVSTFYDVSSGIPRNIGEFAILANTTSSWLSFEHDKIVVQTGAAWHLYDMDYIASENEILVQPIKNELLGNYPNPFNPETTITFTISRSALSLVHGVNLRLANEFSPVKIDIYNIRGQRVRTLVNGMYGAGTHSVVWNGTDDAGRNVGSGIYFYRMTTPEYTATRRMVLMK